MAEIITDKDLRDVLYTIQHLSETITKQGNAINDALKAIRMLKNENDMLKLKLEDLKKEKRGNG
jgi:hypothetical protein